MSECGSRFIKIGGNNAVLTDTYWLACVKAAFVDKLRVSKPASLVDR